MIKTVIKRNGTRESFSAAKFNGWSEWAAKNLGRRVNWSEVVLHVVSNGKEEMTSEEIQESAIKFLIDKHTWEHNLMAGRLYSELMKKQIHGGKKYPTVMELHGQMIADGVMVPMDYSKEEYEQIEKIIDHSLNQKSAHYSLQQNRYKYAIRNKVTGREYETQQFIYMRMAMALSEFEPKETRMTDVAKFYEHLSMKRINAPTPYYVNLGTVLRGYASCCVYTAGDSWPSLLSADNIAYTMTCMSAGIGGHIKTRSLGDPVRNGLIKHQGKAPYYRAQVGMINANMQNGRGGAETMHYTAYDPEAEVIQKFKNPLTPRDKQIRGMDYSFGHNMYFAEQVAKNGQIALFSYYHAPELYEAQYAKDSEKFVKLYNEFLKSDLPRKMVDAREILMGAEIEASETGRHYQHSTYWMNKHTPFIEPIFSSNLCVAPETKILTDKGWFEIASLEDQSVNVWNGKKFSPTVVKKTGTGQRLIKVTTNSHGAIECTPYHRFFVQKTYHTKIPVMKRAHELVPGDKLIKFDLPVVEGTKELELAYENGFFTADGCQTSPNRAIVYLYGEKKDLFDKFRNVVGKISTNDQSGRISFAIEGLRAKHFVPDASYTIQSRLEWLSGFLDGDGCVARNGENYSIQASSINREFLTELQLMLQTIGVNPKIAIVGEAGKNMMPKNDGSGELGEYDVKDSYRMCISSVDTKKLIALGLKQHRLILNDHVPQRDAGRFIVVESVEDEGRVSDTFCFTEPERGMGMFNGILTGNCQEISLPTKEFKHPSDLYKPYVEGVSGEIALCNIAGIVPANIDTDEMYAEVAYYALKMIDFGITRSEYAFPCLDYTAKARMNAGVGIVGLAHHMARNKKKYDDQEGRDFIHETFETHAYHLISASLRLGKEKGNAPWMHKTLWPEGWLPIDTYSKEVDSLVTVPNKRDWEALRAAIIENGGIRNSVVSCHMPAESCLEKGTKIKTEFGDLSFTDIMIKGGMSQSQIDEVELNHSFFDHDRWITLPKKVGVVSTDGMKYVDRVWVNGFSDVVEIEMENGEVIIGTHHHKFLIRLPDGSSYWKMMMDLEVGDDIIDVKDL